MENEQTNGLYSSEEAARRRDEVIRHMANTPPKPHEIQRQKPKKAKPSGADRSSQKRREPPVTP